jgi:hypothetical protein
MLMMSTLTRLSLPQMKDVEFKVARPIMPLILCMVEAAFVLRMLSDSAYLTLDLLTRRCETIYGSAV